VTLIGCHPRFWWAPCCSSLNILCCPIVSLRSELRVNLSVTILPKNDVWSLPPVVCSKAHVLFTLFVFVYGVSNTYCVVVVFLFYFSSFCVSYVASFYGLSIYSYLFSILSHLFICTGIQCLSPQKYGVVIDQGEVYSIQFYVIILLNVVLDTNNIGILVERSYLRHLRLLAFQDNLSPQCQTDMATYWFHIRHR
jgi:hypothetical protein